jgi:hypothetical protein
LRLAILGLHGDAGGHRAPHTGRRTAHAVEQQALVEDIDDRDTQRMESGDDLKKDLDLPVGE